MKPSVLIIGLLITIFGTCTLTAQQVKFGVRAGLNISNVGGEDTRDLDEDENLKYIPGFHLGPYANIGLSESISVEAGALISTKGFEVEYKERGIDYSIDESSEARLTYVDVPIVVSFHPNDRFRIFAGPQISFLVHNKITEACTTCISGVCESESEEYDMDDFLRSTDLGGTFGLGYNFPSGLNLAASYDMGFSSLDSEGESDIFNRVFKVSAGFTF